MVFLEKIERSQTELGKVIETVILGKCRRVWYWESHYYVPTLSLHGTETGDLRGYKWLLLLLLLLLSLLSLLHDDTFHETSPSGETIKLSRGVYSTWITLDWAISLQTNQGWPPAFYLRMATLACLESVHLYSVRI